MSEEDLELLAAYYTELAELARHESAVAISHSVEEARARHEAKARG
jgi:hypothetical protein